MKTLVAVARGRVQGVGYRAFVVDMAISLGLTGWVRNAPDGAVEVEAQGPDRSLELLAEAMKDGPRLAHVSALEATFTERAAYHNFDVRW